MSIKKLPLAEILEGDFIVKPSTLKEAATVLDRLYAALVALTMLSERDLKMNQSDDEEYAGGGWWSTDTVQAIENAKAAIAAAEGEQS